MLLVVFALVACLSSVRADVDISAMGSPIPDKLYQAAIFAYRMVRPEVHITYLPLGSTQANAALVGNDVHWIGTDKLFTASEYAEHVDIQLFPSVGTGVVPVLHLPCNKLNLECIDNEDNHLTFSRKLMVEIFLRNVTMWDDDKIKALNPNLVSLNLLPNNPIDLIVRSDDTKVTEMFQESLTRFDPSFNMYWAQTFPDEPCCSPKSMWPKMDPNDADIRTRDGSISLAQYVITKYNTLSYALVSEAVEFNLIKARIINKQGVDVQADHVTIGNAIADLGSKFDDDVQFTTTMYDSGGTTAWPIVSYSYLAVRMNPLTWAQVLAVHDCDHRKGIASFWKWFMSSGLIRTMCPWMGYAAIPDAVIKLILPKFVAELYCDRTGKVADNRDDEILVVGYGLPQFAEVFKVFQYAYAAQSDTAVQIIFKNEEDDEYRPLDTEASYMITTFQDQSQNKYAQFPIAFYSIIPIYQLWNYTAMQPIKITLELNLLTDIYRGIVKEWTDPKVVALNPKLAESTWDTLGIPTKTITVVVRSDACETNGLFTSGLPNYPKGDVFDERPLRANNNLFSVQTEMEAESAVLLIKGALGYKISVGGTENQVPLIKHEDYEELPDDLSLTEMEDYVPNMVEVIVDPFEVEYLQACRDASSLNTFSGDLLISIEPIRSQDPLCYVWTSVLYLRLKANYLSGGTGLGCKPDTGALGNLVKWYLQGEDVTTKNMQNAGFSHFKDTLYQILLRGVDSLSCDKTVSLLWDPSDICAIDDWSYESTECAQGSRKLVHSWNQPRTCRKGYLLPEEKVIPCEDISNTGVSILTFVGWAIIIMICIIVYDNRTHAVVVRCVTVQQGVLLIGCFLLYALPFMEKDITDTICFLAPMLNILGGGLILGSLAYQTHSAKKPLVFVSLVKYFIYHGILMGMYVLLIVFWMSIDAPEAGRVVKDYGLRSKSEFVACVLSSMFMLVMYLSQLLVILACTWIAWGARMSPGQFNIALHNFWACICFLIRTGARFYVDRVTHQDQYDPDGKYGSLVLIDVFCITGVVMAFWLPRISILYFGENQDDLPSSFEIMLEDAVTRHFIEKVAARQVMSENVKFYTAVKHFKFFCEGRSIDDPEVIAYSKKVYNNYIKENAGQQVNISADQLNTCNKALKFQQDKSTIFDMPLREIKKVCEQNLSKVFMASKEVDKANVVNKWCENFKQFENELQQRVMESLKSNVSFKEEADLTVEDATSNEIKKVVEDKISELHELLTMNILLLGCGESGKSTISRAIKYRHRNDVDQRDVDMVKAALRDNALTSILGLIEAVVKSHCLDRLSEESRGYLRIVINCRDKQSEFDKEVAKAVLKLWQDPLIQDMSMAKHEHWNLELSKYYTKNARRFAQANFIPTQEDMSYVRLQDSLSIIEHIVVEDDLTEEFTYRMMDFAGHRHFRHKWRMSLGHEKSKMVVYTINLAGIFSVTMEDNNVFRITESLRVLEHLMTLQWFKSIPLFVVFTKNDLFAEMVKDCDFGTLLQVFPNYTGGDDAKSIMDYVKIKVDAICRPNKNTQYMTFNLFEKKDHVRMFDTMRRTILNKNKAKLKPLIRRIRMVIEAASGENDEAENPLAGASSDSRAMLGLNF